MTYREVLARQYRNAQVKKAQVEKLASLNGMDKEAISPLLLALPALVGVGGWANSLIKAQNPDTMLKALGGKNTLQNLIAGATNDKQVNSALTNASNRLMDEATGGSWWQGVLPWNWGKMRAARQLRGLDLKTREQMLRGLVGRTMPEVGASMGFTDPTQSIPGAMNKILGMGEKQDERAPLDMVLRLLQASNARNVLGTGATRVENFGPQIAQTIEMLRRLGYPVRT